MSVPSTKAEEKLRRVARERILVLDGAMGTMIQELKLDEQGYRGARFDAWNREVRGNNDLLNLSKPEAVRDIHLAYFRAGADIVSTNTFSSTSIAQADYGMQEIAYELNYEGARLVRAAAIAAENEDGRKRFVTPGLVFDGELVSTDLVEINLAIRILLVSIFIQRGTTFFYQGF